ncbi:ankyrin repeat-containing domain protein [Aspergillus granulosus]|uniref:Ankyrin repeat-containing domain protein n=1 Tax=Aspergillus granulosus TaxID=176169 RepID=A0ABR4GSK1_9EURO
MEFNWTNTTEEKGYRARSGHESWRSPANPRKKPRTNSRSYYSHGNLRLVAVTVNMSLSGMPNEIILDIARYLDMRCLNSLIQTAHQFATLLSTELYRIGAAYPTIRKTTPLLWAVQNHHLNAVQKLLDQGADPTATVKGTTALHEAVNSDNLEAVQLMLRNTSVVLPRDSAGFGPLILAALRGQEAMVRLLVSAGATVVCSKFGEWERAVQRAVADGNDVGCRLLLEAGVQSDGPNGHGLQVCIKYLLEIVATKGNTAMFQLLWTFFVASTSEREYTASRLVASAAHSGSVDFVQWLFSVGATLNEHPPGTNTALHLAASHSRSGSEDTVAYLLDMGARIEAVDASHHTPLLAAMRQGSPDVVRLLLARGANALAIGTQGMNALHLAATYKRPELIPDLYRAGVPVDGRMERNETPLHIAAASGPAESVTALLEAGADINVLRNDRGWTPLHTAADAADAGAGAAEIVSLLIEHGADLSAVDNKGYNALETAAKAGHVNALKILLTATQKANLPILHQSAYGTSALEEAIYHDYADIVTVLLEAGVDPAVSRNGTYPLHLAISFGVEEIAGLLLLNGGDPFLLDERGRSAVDWARLNGRMLPTILVHCNAEAVSQPTDPTLQTSTLRSSLVSLATYLQTSKGVFDDAQHFTRLGGCLVLANNLPAATIALGQMLEKSEEGVPAYYGSCDWCEDGPVLTERTGKYTCLTCYNVNLCWECKEEYDHEEGYSSEKPLFEVCAGHEFLEVRPSSLQLLGEKTEIEGEVKREWLEEIIAKYS